MNLLEELVFCCGIDKEWQDKIEAAEDTGFSTANCNSINVIQDYVISQQERIKELEESLQKYVDAANVGALGGMGKAYIHAVEVLKNK